jgi:hypothetical protein
LPTTTFGFPVDLTELLARERGLKVDVEVSTSSWSEQKERARSWMKNKQVVSVSEIETKDATKFIGYDTLETDAKVLEVVSMKDKTAVVLDSSVCYAEMGGQIGDTGQIMFGATAWRFPARPKSATPGSTSSSKIRHSSFLIRSVAPRRCHAPSRHRATPHRHAHPALGVARGRQPGRHAERLQRHAGQTHL